MSIKKNEVPAKGDIIKAEYVVNGQRKRILDLGTVQDANTKAYTGSDGVKREYNFDAVNGVRLIGFTKPPKKEKKSEEE